MKHNNISPAPKSPQALDNKILSYAREHTPKQQSHKTWYGYAATACAFTIAAIMLPQLLQQAEQTSPLPSISPIAKTAPAAVPPSPQPAMMQEMEEQAIAVAHDQPASQSRHAIKAEDMAQQAIKKASESKDQTQWAMRKASKAKRARAEQKQLSEVMATAARYEPQTAPQQLESLQSQLRQLQQTAKENPAKANSDYQHLREKCDCGLPENLSQAIELLNKHKAPSLE